MENFPIILITIGLLLVIIGAIWIIGNKFNIPLGKLPGDISIKKPGFSFYFPITTAIILSILLTAIIFLINKFLK
jgi:hypothetical protein